MKEITSLQNPLIKLICSLNNKRNIAQSNVTFIEGKKIVLELIFKNYQIKTVLVTQNNYKEFIAIQKAYNFELITISEQVSNKISNTVTNAGVFALIELNKPQEFNKDQKYLVLDTIQDPTNVGAIIRSALAFDYKQIILINSAYPYLPKVIRSSMGYCLEVNCYEFNTNDFVEFCKTNNLKLIGTSMFGTDVNTLSKLDGNYGIVVGNEGNGISDEIYNLCEKFVKIPMMNNVESLNAAVSISIIMNEINKLGR